MAEYKMIPVDQETYDKLKRLCEAYKRKQGAQVRVLVNIEWEKLRLMKFVPVSGTEEAAKAETPEEITTVKAG